MMWRCFILLLIIIAGESAASAQTRLRLSQIVPGTEIVQLVTNGDFQIQGTVTSTNTHPFPEGWGRAGDIFADPGTNMVPSNNGIVARASASGTASVSKYERTITLLPDTEYVLSAYVWNMGNSAGHVTTVIDMKDVPGEPQITLDYSDANADLGYFVYRSFNTTQTGTSLLLRAFCDQRSGAGTASKYYPVAAQWDNLAVTKASEFAAPVASGGGGNLPPVVAITSPQDGTNIVSPDMPVSLQITALASDQDGSVTNVEFYAGSTRLGQAPAAPYSFNWNIPASGSYRLTAVARDNSGGTTISPAVSISATVPTPVPTPALRIVPGHTNFSLLWPTSLTSLSLEWTTNLSAANWRPVTNVPVVQADCFAVSLPTADAQRFFTLSPSVDPRTMTGKLLMGYQGWFAAAGDGSPVNAWVHWFSANTPTAENLHIDFWPDMSELDDDELFNTSMTYSNGANARLYSAYTQKTVVRHFKWMKDYNLDGVFFQRFLTDLPNGNLSTLRNRVAENVRVGAETYGRVFAIMYDISGYSTNLLVSKLQSDWSYLVNTQHVTNSPAYLWHKGKPVVAIWGFGFSGSQESPRLDTPAQAQQAINWFKAAGCTVMGGVPAYWRTLTNDSQTNADWAAVFRSFDVISPWSVGRYRNYTEADDFKLKKIMPDLQECINNNIDYMPVIFPGFSWANLKKNGLYNSIPRNGGNFYWRQAYNALDAQCTMLYGAMFDEVDEGTAMYKVAPTAADVPAQGTFVTLDADGYKLGSDWYLRLADQAGKMLRGEIPLQLKIPINP